MTRFPWGPESSSARNSTTIALAVAVAIVVLLGGCAQTRSDHRPPTASTASGDVDIAAPARSPTCAVAGAGRRAQRALDAARGRYSQEASGSVIHADLARIARDRALIAAMSAQDRRRALAAANRQLVHHVVRIRVLRGRRALVDANSASFDVAGSAVTLRGPHGRSLGRLEITVQDVIGFIKLAIRREGANAVLVRGPGGRVRTSLPALAALAVPPHGCVTVGTMAYVTRSFTVRGFAGGRLRIWILVLA